MSILLSNTVYYWAPPGIQKMQTVNRLQMNKKNLKKKKKIRILLRVVEWVTLLRFLFGVYHY